MCGQVAQAASHLAIGWTARVQSHRLVGWSLITMIIFFFIFFNAAYTLYIGSMIEIFPLHLVQTGLRVHSFPIKWVPGVFLEIKMTEQTASHPSSFKCCDCEYVDPCRPSCLIMVLSLYIHTWVSNFLYLLSTIISFCHMNSKMISDLIKNPDGTDI